MSDGKAVLHRRMPGILVRCILAMSDGESKSTFCGVAEGASIVCLDGGITKVAGLVSLVGG